MISDGVRDAIVSNKPNEMLDGRDTGHNHVEYYGGYLICESVLPQNRSLIAAAPAMYDAIKEYLEWGPMTASDREIHERSFRKAISAAEGRAE